MINLTPHAINILNDNNNIIQTLPSEGIIRVNTKKTLIRTIIINDKEVPIYKTEFTSLDIQTDNCIQDTIVSRIVKNHPDIINRDNFIVPDEIVRDKEGNILGCKSFSL